MAPQFVRSIVREMTGYTPGEQPDAGERVVKLNTNENPLSAERSGDAGAWRESAARRCGDIPNPTADVFRDAAAKLHGP